MNIEESYYNQIAILKFSGKLDTITYPVAEEYFGRALDKGYVNILVDFEKLDYLSSAGLRVLLGTAKRLQGKGGISICRMNDDVKEVLEMTGLANLVFKVYKDEKQAYLDFGVEWPEETEKGKEIDEASSDNNMTR